MNGAAVHAPIPAGSDDEGIVDNEPSGDEQQVSDDQGIDEVLHK